MYITKIEGITVKQDNNSTLKVTNKSADRKDVVKGENKQVDLGDGSKDLNTSLLITDSNTFDSVFSVLRKKRYVTFTDKFMGDFKAYVKSYEIVNSDKHIGLTIINLNLKINEIFNPKVSFKGAILSNLSSIRMSNAATMPSNTNSSGSNNAATSPTNLNANMSPINTSPSLLNIPYIPLNNNLAPTIQHTALTTNGNLPPLETKEVIVNDMLNKINDFNNFINSVEQLSTLGFKHDTYIKPIEPLPIDSNSSLKNAINSNLNLNTIQANNLYIEHYLGVLLTQNNNYQVGLVKEALLTLIDNNIALNNACINPYTVIDYYEIKNNIISYFSNTDFSEILTITFDRYTNIAIWCYKYYGELILLNDLKELNNIYTDLWIGEFKYFKKVS